jgi:hypothetical protein
LEDDMFVSALVAAATMAAAPSVPWTRDYTRTFTDAEEQRRPVQLFFATHSGGGFTGNQPVNPLAAGGPIEHQEGLSACERMQQDVWEDAGIVGTAQRFLPVLVDGGDRTLQVRYQAVRMPTMVVTDPWGNEVFRTSGYLPRDKVSQILTAIPADFAPLTAAGRALKANPADFRALVAAAQFYEGAGLPQVSDRLYASALDAPGATDVVARRQAVISRGLNLMARLGRAEEAAALFEKELAAAPDGPGSDALWLGLVNARLSQGRPKEAEAAVKQMEAKFAGSPYTARAKQNLAAAKK